MLDTLASCLDGLMTGSLVMPTAFGYRPLVNGSRQLDFADGRFRGAARHYARASTPVAAWNHLMAFLSRRWLSRNVLAVQLRWQDDGRLPNVRLLKIRSLGWILDGGPLAAAIRGG